MKKSTRQSRQIRAQFYKRYLRAIGRAMKLDYFFVNSFLFNCTPCITAFMPDDCPSILTGLSTRDTFSPAIITRFNNMVQKDKRRSCRYVVYICNIVDVNDASWEVQTAVFQRVRDLFLLYNGLLVIDQLWRDVDIVVLDENVAMCKVQYFLQLFPHGRSQPRLFSSPSQWCGRIASACFTDMKSVLLIAEFVALVLLLPTHLLYFFGSTPGNSKNNEFLCDPTRSNTRSLGEMFGL